MSCGSTGVYQHGSEATVAPLEESGEGLLTLPLLGFPSVLRLVPMVVWPSPMKDVVGGSGNLLAMLG